ncbi:MAG: hypothetical protein MJ061_02690 [Mailhella sp.]|nr:hypothetical protein [Mailhella sp.]
MSAPASVTCGSGPLAVTARAGFVGGDLVAVVTGGTSPHAGAVALAVPCAPTPEGTDCSASVLCAPGHRDDIPARQLAMRLCKALRCTVSMTVGIHLDNASADDIRALLRHAESAVEGLEKALKD